MLMATDGIKNSPVFTDLSIQACKIFIALGTGPSYLLRIRAITSKPVKWWGRKFLHPPTRGRCCRRWSRGGSCIEPETGSDPVPSRSGSTETSASSSSTSTSSSSCRSDIWSRWQPSRRWACWASQKISKISFWIRFYFKKSFKLSAKNKYLVFKPDWMSQRLFLAPVFILKAAIWTSGGHSEANNQPGNRKKITN